LVGCSAEIGSEKLGLGGLGWNSDPGSSSARLPDFWGSKFR